MVLPLEPANHLENDDSMVPAAVEPTHKPKISKWLVRLLLLSLLCSSGYVALRQLALAQQRPAQRPLIARVEQTDLTITVSANGTVEPEQVVNVSPKTAGVLKQLLVDEGNTVKEDQIMAYMDDSNLQGQLTQARGQVAKAEAELDKALAGNRSEEIAQEQARLVSAQADLAQAEDDLRRNQELMDSGAISRQTYNKAVTARDVAAAKLAEVQQALALSQAGSRQEDIDAARAQVTAAKGTLQTIQSEINDTVIRAPFSGTVTRKYADPGAFVTPTTAGSSVSSATSSSILSLASTNRVVANVSESNISKIKVGQPVTITADAFPDKTFQGKVYQIATQAIVQQNVTSFAVKVTLLGEAKTLLRSGMNVAADFQVGQVKDAMTVPTVAVTHQNDVSGVYVGAPNQPPRFIPITTGATIGERTEVKSGLSGTEHILINVPTAPPPSAFSWLKILGLGGSDRPPGGGPPGGGPPPGGSRGPGGPPGGGGGPGGPPG